MGQAKAVLVHDDVVAMSIDLPATLVPPVPMPEGKLNALHGGVGQSFVHIGSDLACVLGVETSATAKAKYINPPYIMPGDLTFSVQANGITRSAFVFIGGKAILLDSGSAVKVGVQVAPGQAAKPPPPPQPPLVPPIDKAPHSGAGTILSTRQSFVTVTG